MERIYLDYAATTPLDPRVREAMEPWERLPLNPSSQHQSGQRARRRLEADRARLAELIGLEDPQDVIFTSGATESANLALRGFATRHRTAASPRVFSSLAEHSCVVETKEALAATNSVESVSLPIAPTGRVVLDPAAFDLREGETPLLCVIHANNETGVLQDLDAARQFAKALNALWLCDASQSLGRTPVHLGEIGADLLLGSAHKFYGPHGVGFLAGSGVAKLRPQMTGGPQENERRGGTPPVALIHGMVQALELAQDQRETECRRLDDLAEKVLIGLETSGIYLCHNGDGPRLPGFLNLSFPHLGTSMDLSIALDAMGLEVSPGAACSTGVVQVSPLIAAMFPQDTARAASAVRVTMGRGTTEAHVEALVEGLANLRQRAAAEVSRQSEKKFSF